MNEIVTGWPMVNPDRADLAPWTSTVDRGALDANGIAYLLLETLDGKPIAWAPLGSANPFPDGEGTHWRIRAVGV